MEYSDDNSGNRDRNLEPQRNREDGVINEQTEARTCATCAFGYMEMMGLCSHPVKHFARLDDERGYAGNCGPNGMLWEAKTAKPKFPAQRGREVPAS